MYWSHDAVTDMATVDQMSMQQCDFCVPCLTKYGRHLYNLQSWPIYLGSTSHTSSVIIRNDLRSLVKLVLFESSLSLQCFYGLLVCRSGLCSHLPLLFLQKLEMCFAALALLRTVSSFKLLNLQNHSREEEKSTSKTCHHHPTG